MLGILVVQSLYEREFYEIPGFLEEINHPLLLNLPSRFAKAGKRGRIFPGLWIL